MLVKRSIKISFLMLYVVLSSCLQASQKALLNISSTSQSVNQEFSLKQLQQLPQQKITAQLPWCNEVNTYEGPLLEDVFKLAGIQGRWLTFTGLDNYQISFDYKSIKEYKPILALQRDGELLSIRTKGPLLLVLPIDQYSELNTPLYHDYMVWQLIKIGVEDVKGSL
ncbi:molybdopterin-binding oxidoreductase [Psychromonas sp. psych-6C06]|uniref:molybdopterin-dependent oxidoreductase n=1 Tax=Psychromonas sp. psych-6C06 TaxID=2058089 RepID=UPI000C31ED89|nr:molybdopterin-dependent oxidoreductase [Psychromonas sp. psych-6C06]PKF61955.1 molybdopterin-binding oxidoreductase [Psychromonas sp. psych-6C06]